MKEIFHFTANWCNPCKVLNPLVDEILEDYPGLAYTRVDADEKFDVAHVLGVRSIPTIIVMEGNAELKRHVGTATRDQIIEIFDFVKEK